MLDKNGDCTEHRYLFHSSYYRRTLFISRVLSSLWHGCWRPVRRCAVAVISCMCSDISWWWLSLCRSSWCACWICLMWGRPGRHFCDWSAAVTGMKQQQHQWLPQFAWWMCSLLVKKRVPYPHWGVSVRCSCSLLRHWARRWINHLSLWHMASATPDLRLPSQSQDIAATRLIPNYTAWWQRHMCVNNLPKVVTWQWNGGELNSWPLESQANMLLHHRSTLVVSWQMRLNYDGNVFG